MARRAICYIILVFIYLPIQGWCLTIGTVEEPPGNFIDPEGNITGLSVDFVREIQRRTGNTDPIEMLPGARLMQLARHQRNVVVFSLSRTPEREEKFHWIALVMRKPLALFATYDSPVKILSLADARTVESIGLLRSSVQYEFLRNWGFSNVVPANSHLINLRKLSAGRITLMYHSIQGMAELCRQEDLEFSRFKTVLMPQISLSCIAMSKTSDPALVRQWQAAAREIKEDGTFETLAQKWIQYTRSVVGIPCQFKDGAVQFWEE